jgi:hypothetical protein
MDNLSIRSNSLRRINNDVDYDESVSVEDIENRGATVVQLSQPLVNTNDDKRAHSTERNPATLQGDLYSSQEKFIQTTNSSNEEEGILNSKIDMVIPTTQIIDDEETAVSNKSVQSHEEFTSENANSV